MSAVPYSTQLGYPASISNSFPIGNQSVLITPQRSIGGFTAQVTIEEMHNDELAITDHPVETGAIISDHAYMRPSELMIRCGWSNSPSAGPFGLANDLVSVPTTSFGTQSTLTGAEVNQVQQVYQNLLSLQSQRIPFQVFTGKRAYDNMMVKSIRVVTDKESENTLMVMIHLRQVIIVSTQVVSVDAPAANQANPESTAAPVNTGTQPLIPGTNFNQGAGGGRGAINP